MREMNHSEMSKVDGGLDMSGVGALSAFGILSIVFQGVGTLFGGLVGW